jgi:receptor protein-tyrosine kinase
MAQACIDQAIERRRLAAQETYDGLRPHLEQLRAAFQDSEARRRPRAAPEADMYRHFYGAMLQKAGDAWMASRVRQPNIRVVGAAEPATRPYKPNLPLNLAIATFSGLVLGAGFVMLQAQNHTFLSEPGEAAQHLTLPELAAIPRTRLSRIGPADQPPTDLPESFRIASASILSATRQGDRRRTFVVTSAWPEEGKTTIVSNLGIALAEISDKVLLIDGDMRRPELHKVFNEANSWGLSDVLRETNAIDELPVDVLVKKTSVPHVYLLPSGASPDNIFGLLCAERMSRLLPRFQEKFDYVLVDAPPCLEFADARIMAQHGGELLFVVRANHTHRRAAQAAIERIRLDGIPVMGVILNRWDQRRSTVYSYPRSNGNGLGGLV